MQEEEFKVWLGKRIWKGQPLTKKPTGNRVRRSQRAERGLHSLGFTEDTLDELHDAGKWLQLLDKLTTLKDEPEPDREVVRAVVPKAEDPVVQLSNMIAALKQYGYFRDGRDPNYSTSASTDEDEDEEDESQADKTRRYVLDNYITPARVERRQTVTVTVGPLNNEMGLQMAWPNICQALEGRLFLELANVPPPTAEGPQQSTTRKLTFSLKLKAGKVTGPKQLPTNLILFGPPGTGKTYQTAREAVALCDGSADYPDTGEGRAALMDRYRDLETEKRIAFVTFHQNYDYENFVEGLRPETGDDEGATAGFRLEARPGIFREICALADQARTRTVPSSSATGSDFTDRRFWKMGQGAIGSEDEVYDAAIANDYITLGWGGTIDWSAERFSTFEAIKAEWLEKNPDDLTPSNWTQMWPFRCEMKVGDIVIVPYGNTAFRAIAEVTGNYRYEPSAEGHYAHRRDVRWLLTLDEPLALDTIVDGNFTMRTLYSIPTKRVNLPALGRLIGDESSEAVAAGAVEPDQFVLIIDEINRANISKVFGELITLIEPDKRLGMDNALTLTLPYSKKRDFGVPANLHIIGTMNTADRSIALLDTALRRRFVFQEIAPRPELLGTVDRIDLKAVLTKINDRIEYLIDREHCIGHAFFMGCDSRGAVHNVMRDKVISYNASPNSSLSPGTSSSSTPGMSQRASIPTPPRRQSFRSFNVLTGSDSSCPWGPSTPISPRWKARP